MDFIRKTISTRILYNCMLLKENVNTQINLPLPSLKEHVVVAQNLHANPLSLSIIVVTVDSSTV